jgi:hypothetical protein
MPPPPAVQAANVLRAWVSCDEAAFRCELGKTFDLRLAQTTAGEEERVELLKVVAASLRQAPLGAVSNSLVHLCVDLLVHLSDQSACETGIPCTAAGVTD